MNVKKAKHLRRLVRQFAASKEANLQKDHAFVENESRRVYVDANVPTAAVDESGKSIVTTERKRIPICPGTLQLSPATKRGFYKNIKRAFKGETNIFKTPETTTDKKPL